ncbi:DUF1127 domain-containing protein [Martelella radicis]|uniref:Uncharacterized protein YjiS (DUF1127 family) n=1 Tax=Martelella radicis TaxID=1397476 RepID=A0A7W6PD44_9HYPH|nr:DUF1127 domain-containing protein [Martelella radicis]MBB4124062.1 uncharacterized protein YjiS (DUF1127 family) [Martelella radicis]
MSFIERAPASRALAHRHHSLFAGFAALRAAFARFAKNRAAIRYMADMDDALLKDIGLSRLDVDRAYMAPVKEDPMVDLKRAACNRSQRMVI